MTFDAYRHNIPADMATPSPIVGAMVSHYRVLRKLGAGGMGEVYEAEDIRLRRRVALKFLSENLQSNQKALQRFEHEARAASSLNHPGICMIHEVEEHNGQPLLVMELLEGENLKERIRRGPIPKDELLSLGIQIADALEAAHIKGMIHRDVKPANIFVVGPGRTKILDFGLAKMMSAVGAEDQPQDESLTEEGVIPGTTPYMSPEQVKGEEIDSRSDLFSLGVVLYESATGQKPFARKNRVLTHDAILNAHPAPPATLNPALPEELDGIINKCLEKDRNSRYQHASEIRSDLLRLRRELESGSQRTPSATERTVPPAESASDRPAGVRLVGGIIPRWIWKTMIPAGIVAVIAVVLVTFEHKLRATALTEKDTIVLADFDNRTGDPVFDDTLKQALAVDLGQSPFLNILSDRRVTATLRLMNRSPDQPVIGEVAREVCQRVSSKAMLAGSISAIGDNYVIGLSAINCATGDALVKQQVEARGKEDVLKALSKASTDMRGRLGESLASAQKSATPIEEATTSSLEALKAYSLGRKVIFQKGDAAALPYFQRAVEIDPNFALAFRNLSVVYYNLGQSTLSSQVARRAFQLRERVSERERYAVDGLYYTYGSGEIEKANQAYDVWQQSYPRDSVPLTNLGDNYMKLGQWEKALSETKDSLLRDPNAAITYSNLAWMQLALNRTEDASATVETALTRNMDTYFLRLVLYEIAFLRGEQERMQAQLAWAAGRPHEEDWLLWAQSDTEAYFGRLVRAREFSQRAVNSALRIDAKETAALWQVNGALQEAEFGNIGPARQYATAALALAPGRDVRSAAALTLARAGQAVEAKRLADALGKDFSQDTLMQGYWLPTIRAAIEINEKNPAKALDFLKSAAPYELAECEPFQIGMMYPVYLRGQAYLQARQGKEATFEFQNIIDHKGIVLNFPLAALAHLGLGRALALNGDTANARAAYQHFFILWKDADRDIPILKQAKAEYAKLQ